MRYSVQIGLLLGILLASPSLEAAVLIPIVPVAGSTGTIVYGINDSNTIVGYYVANHTEHGFFGSLDGQYTTFDYGLSFTEPRAINNAGDITGIADDANDGIQFERKSDGSIKTITRDGSPVISGIAQGINSKGLFVGAAYDQGFNRYAYYGKRGKYRETFTLPDGATDPEPRAINDSNTVVGHSSDDGFMLRHGIESIIDYPDPDAAHNFLEGINKKGVIAGYWQVANSQETHAFTFDSKSNTFQPINIPGATTSSAIGINSAGLVAITSDAGVFIYCPHSKRSGKCPGNGTEIPDAKPIYVQLRTIAVH